MIICDACDEPIFEPHGMLVSPPDEDGFSNVEHFHPECFCDIFHNHDEVPECKSWCNSLFPEGKLDDKGVKYCNCRLLDDHKESK